MGKICVMIMITNSDKAIQESDENERIMQTIRKILEDSYCK